MISYKDLTDEEIEFRIQQEKKRRQEWPLRFLRTSLALVIVGAVAYLGIIEEPFNSARWKAHSTSSSVFLPSVRRKMATNLVRGDKLQGLSRTQVFALLGKPDDSDTTAEISYVIGLSGINPVSFRIELDGQQHVLFTEIYIHRTIESL